MGRLTKLAVTFSGLGLVGGLAACSSDSNSPATGSPGEFDAAGTDATSTDGGGTPEAATNDGAVSDAGDGGSSSLDGASAAPVVVASFGRVPASLALAGSTLYVTLAETPAGNDGAVVSLPKTSSAATLDGGAITTLVASGLHLPRAIVADGLLTASHVYWAGQRVDSTGNITGIAVSGGAPFEVAAGTSDVTRVVLENNTLFATTVTSVSSYALGFPDGSAPHVVWPGNPPAGIPAIDADGTSVYFFANGTTNFDLFSIPSAGGSITDLAKNVTSGSVDFDYLIDDATTLYWSDSGTGSIFSEPKTGGVAPKLLATFASGSGPAQIALDGNNVYALWSQQLARFPKSGGTPTVLASVSGAGSDRYLASLGNAIAMAIDDTSVYWLFEGTGQVLRIAK